MQRTTGNIIADSLESAVSYANRLMQDIPHIEAARFARPGGQIVSSNHPCFIFGHLSLYPPKVLSQLKQSSLPIPTGFEKTFDKTATCRDDSAKIRGEVSQLHKAAKAGRSEDGGVLNVV